MLHKELSNVDPLAAKQIQPTDTRRIIHALEVSAYGNRFSESGHGPPYTTLYKLVLPVNASGYTKQSISG